MVNTDASQKFTKQGLTFDDVLLVPAESNVCLLYTSGPETAALLIQCPHTPDRDSRPS